MHANESESLLKATAQAVLIGLAGATAMFATELLLFPNFVSAEWTKAPATEVACASVHDAACTVTPK